MEEQFYTIILRHDTSTKWLVNDPILSLGEYGVEDDTHKVKRGDGESKWSELLYEDFGLQYIVTFANLNGDLKDNEILTQEFEKKLSKNIFDDVNNSVVVAMNITNDSDETIGKISKTVKEIELGGTTISNLIISSSDKSIQGVWAIDDSGARTLNLTAKSTINDYQSGKVYNRDYICYYNNKLYRAVETFEAEPTFNETHWALLASLHSGDIRYDNLSSGLDSDNVKGALDELKRRDDRKVVKSTEERIVYGTNANGEQTVIPIDDLRKVDTVNHKQADINKNIQLDASEIKYSDANPGLGSIREVLDEKVDKDFAGHNAKIVRDIRTEYDEETGHIKIIEDKVSPRDGTSDTEIREIDVVAEAELLDNVNRINTRIDNEVQDINDRIDTEVGTLNDRIDTEVETLNTTINTKETEIYTKIQEEHDEINDRVDTEVETLNARVDDEVDTLNSTINDKEAAIYRRIQDEHNEINTRVTDEVATLNNTINTKEAGLQQQINTNASEISRVESEQTAENVRIENESKQRDNNLASQIADEVVTLNNRIDSEVQTLNDRVDDEVQDLNNRIDDEVQTLNDTIDTKEAEMDNKKIDKDLSTLLVTEIEADVDASTNEPTMKITRKNTTTKESVVNHLHFKAKGNIQTRFVDADHIEIDSSAIDGINTEQNRRLGIVDERLNAHDTDIASLQEHDVAHDNMLATHTSQIAQHEQRIHTNETNITELDRALNTEKTTRQNMDDALSARITTNAVEITTKADKEFADTTGDKVVGKLESDEIRNAEILNLKQTMVSPVDNSSSVERLKVISSDNTVIATRLQDGTIDIATNLDTDVNYFVTTDIISTTIGADTILDMNNLTPTDKQVVELQDIISDPEGTWGRVKAIDTENNECTVVTFKKHAQAVWGTIKGNIADQQDLQTALDDLGDTKVDKTTSSNQVYGTDENGEQTTYNKEDFGKVDTVNNISADGNKNVKITANDIQAFSDEVITESGYSSDSIMKFITSVLEVLDRNWGTRQINEYVPGTYYQSAFNQAHIDYFDLDIRMDNNGPMFVTITRDDGILLMAKVLTDFSSDNSQATPYESFMYDVEVGNLKLVGIPEQQGDETPAPQPSWELYQTIGIYSVTSSDGVNPLVEVYQDTNGIYNVGFNIVNNSNVDNLVFNGTIWSGNAGPMGDTTIFGFNLENDYTYYDNESAILEEFSFEYEAQPDWQLVSQVTINSLTSSDGVNPQVNVYEDVGGVTANTKFEAFNNSNLDTMIITRIDDGTDYYVYSNSSTEIMFQTENAPSYYTDENKILEVFNFYFEEPQPEPDWQSIDSFQLESPLSSDNVAPEILLYEDINNIDTSAGFQINNGSSEQTLHMIFTAQNGSVDETNIAPSGTAGLYFEADLTPADIDLEYIENHFQFDWVSNPTGSLSITLRDNDTGNELNPGDLTNLDCWVSNPETGESFSFTNYSTTAINFFDLPVGSYEVGFSSDEYDMFDTASVTITQDTLAELELAVVTKSSEDEETFNILNDVMGTSDSYDGLGGTEEEIENILDDILGNIDEDIDPNLLDKAEDILWNWLSERGEIGAESDLQLLNTTANGNIVTGDGYNPTDDVDYGTFEIDTDNETVTRL